MSSSANIVTRAMRRLRLLEASEDPDAYQAANGLLALNAMIAGWAADGINVSPDVPLPSKHEEGVVAMLAVRLADDFGATVSPGVASDAQKGLSRLMADYISAPLATFDTGLTGTFSRLPLSTTITPTIDDWAASTAYVVFDRVLSDDRHIYQCIIAGTSASTGNGPHGTGQEITDGTVTWRFVGFNT